MRLREGPLIMENYRLFRLTEKIKLLPELLISLQFVKFISPAQQYTVKSIDICLSMSYSKYHLGRL